MTAQVGHDWLSDFGVQNRRPPTLFRGKDELTASTPQAHVMRRAFELLELDGVLCTANAPLIYFKEMQTYSSDEALRIHRQFWNHGGAPILVLITPDNVQVYSGMSRPVPSQEIQDKAPSLVKTLDRVASVLKTFVVSVESGDFFREYASWFNPKHRVDSDLLTNLKETRDALQAITPTSKDTEVLDALLCRLVFACYLFDRNVIGNDYLGSLSLRNASHLRDILSIRPAARAQAALYQLFKKLGKDFNGDLFSDDLAEESSLVTPKHIELLSDFFHGTLVASGQRAFWPYDFGVIPIETISAIYENFLQTDKQDGAFYTPRFLAEVVLDMAVDELGSVLNKKFLDPACGSGIFLVGLFNRMAEEWKQKNPRARNDRRARELMHLLQNSLFGVDVNPTACRITAFSLYLAYLDQLSPRDIKELQRKGRALPRLIEFGSRTRDQDSATIRCVDFFSEPEFPSGVDLVVGNPPWGSTASEDTPPGAWCKEHSRTLPDKQIAIAFIWKAAEHIVPNGRVCLVLPHGVLFNKSRLAVAFQREWLTSFAVQRILNLADFRWFLFSKAVHPAVVVRFEKTKPDTATHRIDYWAPKTDWTTTQAEVIPVQPMDRASVLLDDVLRDLEGSDAPQIWKQRSWATPRDVRFLERLSFYPRLRDRVRASSRGDDEDRPWVLAEGFQPLGQSDDPKRGKTLELPSTRFLDAASLAVDLFILPSDCRELNNAGITVREKSNKNTSIFKAPHVLVSKGLASVVFAKFDVAFHDAFRGISGPESDSNLLAFLAAYLGSPLARYYLFHTSSNWGVARPLLRVQELLRVPFPMPHHMSDVEGKQKIVDEVASIINGATKAAEQDFIRRSHIVSEAREAVDSLIEEYFDIQPVERTLIRDTVDMVIPSIQPRPSQMPVPTVQRSSEAQRRAYCTNLCDTLNAWAKSDRSTVRGTALASDTVGAGMVILEKSDRSLAEVPLDATADILESLVRLREIASASQDHVDPVRGVMLFDKNRLYILKPIAQRYWTQTASLNDADEIAGTILMHSLKERV